MFVRLYTVESPEEERDLETRVKLLPSGEPDWITVPIVRSDDGLRRVDEMEIDESGRGGASCSR